MAYECGGSLSSLTQLLAGEKSNICCVGRACKNKWISKEFSHFVIAEEDRGSPGHPLSPSLQNVSDSLAFESTASSVCMELCCI